MEESRQKKISNVYKLLQNEFLKLERYVPLKEDFLFVYSSAYEELLLKIGDEFSSYISEYVKLFIPKQQYANILDFYKVAKQNCECILKKGVLLKKNDWIIYPWTFSKNEKGKTIPPEWWQVYNEIKHHRLAEYDNETKMIYNHVTLKNIMLAMSALYLVQTCIKNHSCPNALNKVLHKELGQEYNTCPYYEEDKYFALLNSDSNFYDYLYLINIDKSINHSEYNTYLMQYTSI